MSTPKRGRGRPKKLLSVSTFKLTIEEADAEAAEKLVPVLDRASTLGMRHSRTDVLRACIKRGLESLRAELGQKA